MDVVFAWLGWSLHFRKKVTSVSVLHWAHHPGRWKCNAGHPNRCHQQTNFLDAVWGRSLMYMLNRLGERTEPYSKPFFWCLQELHLLPMWTPKRLSRRNSAIMSTTHCGMTLESFTGRPKCQTVSYAAVRSRKMTPVFCLHWNPFSMNVVSARTWSQVLRTCLKPAYSTTVVSSRVGLIRCMISRSMTLKHTDSNEIGR